MTPAILLTMQLWERPGVSALLCLSQRLHRRLRGRETEQGMSDSFFFKYLGCILAGIKAISEGKVRRRCRARKWWAALARYRLTEPV